MAGVLLALMRMTLVSHSNTLLTPVVGLLLCTPKYLMGTMTLGEVLQAAAHGPCITAKWLLPPALANHPLPL